MKKRNLFRKPCRRCDELFRPKGRYCMYCDNCRLNVLPWYHAKKKAETKHLNTR